jgi:predicted MFS family arabinose efflux permease
MSTPFSSYQKKVMFLIFFVQFAVIVDFMVLAPLGEFVQESLKITEQQYSLIVAAYAFAAFGSALLASLFADKFDRKKLLIFFFTGFIFGTLYCAMATTYTNVLLARLITGFFGGVMSSISFAIVTDLFLLDQRGRAMGGIQMGFGLSQVLGIPLALYIYNVSENWQLIFYVIVVLAIFILLGVIFWMKPVDQHLKETKKIAPLKHLKNTLLNKLYLRAFAATVLLATGGFMIMPFANSFAINNIKLLEKDLPLFFAIVGVFTFFGSLFSGKLADRMNRITLFGIGTFISIVIVLVYSNLEETNFWVALGLNCILFIGITSRIIPAQAIMTTVPKPEDRGIFMSVNAAIQQLSGGVAAMIAGFIVSEEAGTKRLLNYNVLGVIVAITMTIAFVMFWRMVKKLSFR